MCRILMVLLLVVLPIVLVARPAKLLATEPTQQAVLRAKAALALALAPPTYAELRQRAIREGKPLIVWVGQPTQSLRGVLSLRLDTFPDASPESVVIGIPTGETLHRVDLSGRPSEPAIRAAMRAVN
jgi:hypothetical protein